MSTYLKPSLYSKRGQENQLLNIIYQSHDLTCGCKTPREHLLHLIQREECHLTTTTGEETTQDGDVEDLLDDGVLEKIFDQELTEDDDG